MRPHLVAAWVSATVAPRLGCNIDARVHVRVDMHRYLPGLLFLQGATGALVWATMVSDVVGIWALLLAMVLLAVAAAFWCAAISRHRIDLAVAKASSRHGEDIHRLKERSAKERSRYEATARRERRQLERRVAWKSRTKTVFAFGAAGAFGILMLLTELFTLGLLTLGSAGSGIAGYLLHWRQTRSFEPPPLPETPREELPALPYRPTASTAAPASDTTDVAGTER